MSSPWTAMLFAASVTAVLGSTAIVAGGVVAALPLYALIMVCPWHILQRAANSINFSHFSNHRRPTQCCPFRGLFL
jgi:hypothetical protein